MIFKKSLRSCALDESSRSIGRVKLTHGINLSLQVHHEILPMLKHTSFCLMIRSIVNPFTLRVPIKSIVCYFYTFENNLRIEGMFAKYLKDSCFVASD